MYRDFSFDTANVLINHEREKERPKRRRRKRTGSRSRSPIRGLRVTVTDGREGGKEGER